MIRTGLIELLLFLVPFAIYAVFLFATRSGVIDLQLWPVRHVLWLAIVALMMALVGFFYLARFSGAPIGSTYVPAHLENGKLIPGAYQ